MTAPLTGAARHDLDAILALIDPGSRVLDVGCGDGELLLRLQRERGVDGRGIELSQAGVNQCVARGLPVIQGDADRDLANYPDGAFDYVVLSQTIQATRNPKIVLLELLRIGRRAVVSFPNFGHYDVRFSIFFRGRMPQNDRLPYSWYDTPNIHFFTIRDFVELCRDVDVTILDAFALGADSRRLGLRAPWWFWNLFGAQGMFLLTREGDRHPRA